MGADDRWWYGEYVYELVNEGAGMVGLRVGMIAKAGAKMVEVVWESGHRNRYPQGYQFNPMDFKDWTDEERMQAVGRIESHLRRGR